MQFAFSNQNRHISNAIHAELQRQIESGCDAGKGRVVKRLRYNFEKEEIYAVS